MRIVFVCLIAILAGGIQTGCNDHDADDRVNSAEAQSKEACKIVFARGSGMISPRIIAASDKTPENDALKYFKAIGDENQEGITGAVYQQAWKSFDCVAPKSSKKTCAKHVRVSYGVGHLKKLKKDLFIVQAERFCQFK